MFNSYGLDRIACWKQFRDHIETSNTPFEDCAVFWSHAPFVNPYLNAHSPASWPDPWKLIIDQKYDNLAISLGMLYTLKLTNRFSDSVFEIVMTTHNETDKLWYLVVDNKYVLNYTYAEVVFANDIDLTLATVLFTITPATKF